MARTAPRHPAGILPRVIFGVALFGILVVTHLWLQKSDGFAAGCSGFADVSVTSLAETMATEPGCETVTNSVYATFLGVSNIVWGLLFYGLVALLRLGYAATGNDRLRLASFGAVGVGFLYTLYLVYLQSAVIGAFCVLCMTSAATVTALLILHAMEHARLRRGAPVPARPPAPFAIKPYALVAVVFAVLLVADVVVAQQREAPEDTAAAVEEPATPDRAEAPPAIEVADPATQCTYDTEFQDVAAFSEFTDGPYLGSADATVEVVEIFDPNCPHCKDLGEVLHGVIEEQGDNARFYFQPFPLRENSFGQVAALYIAEEQGRFFEMMDALFERQNPAVWGMTLDQIVAAGEDAGLDGASLRARLEDEGGLQPVIARILADRVATVEALSTEQGISVPKLLINGDLVAPTMTSYSADCLT
ncbi:MAG: vitamin K epoxide reductase family protein, partial [Rubricoccaceae bacterium]|nr:vitamin K epoxide reductase family protein [Rubricoccaceae bacterium]